MKLKIADDLSLPLDAVTQTFLIVGKRGSGKSNTAARFVEQLHAAKLPFVVLDPVDTWWGLKATADGGPGLNVYVFGGAHKDLPLEAGGGALIAEVLCEHRIPMVLSVKHLSGRERSAFMVAFAQTLFQKWQGGPLHVVLEEAHELAPQMAASRGGQQDGEAAMLGAFKRLWKLGRSSGIGGSAITQRPASLSKDITTQSEILIAHRTIGPQDVKAIGEWIKYHGERDDILGELPSLPTGDAYVWAPEFPEGNPIGLKRTAILRRQTFDSASTPKVGERRIEPKELAPVDIERLNKQLAATIEKAKADDPRELRKQIAELKKQHENFARDASKPKVVKVPERTIEKFVLKDGQIDKVHHLSAMLAERAIKIFEPLQKIADQITAAANEIAGAVRQTHTPTMTPREVAPRQAPVMSTHVRRAVPAATASRPAHVVSHDGGPLPPGELATLTAALQYPGLDRKRLGILTGYKRSSRDAYIARLASKGLVELAGGSLHPTEAGAAALNGSFEPLPTGAALIDYWRARLPEGERKVLDVLIEDGEVQREHIDEMTGYKRSSRDAYLVRLKARGLVEFTGRGTVTASAELFD